MEEPKLKFGGQAIHRLISERGMLLIPYMIYAVIVLFSVLV